MNVLVIAPHPDDEAIGCGGSLCRHADAGDRLVSVFLTSGELGLKKLSREAAWEIRETEAQNAAKILGVAVTHFLRQPDWTLADNLDPAANSLAPILSSERPQVVYVPHTAEWHPDHKAAATVLRRGLSAAGIASPEIRTYEVWTPLAQYDVVVDITAVMGRKVQAIRAHASQFHEIDYARAAEGLNAYRGAIASRTLFAEVFGNVGNEATP
jgi:LmbE family N-acetylglucosaminyl deacetylase